MSRVKKTRSLARVNGVKTGSKEKTKLMNKLRKEQKKAKHPQKENRQKSVYEKYLESLAANPELYAAAKAEQAGVKPPKAAKPAAPAPEFIPKTPKNKVQKAVTDDDADNSEDLWDQLERPRDNDIY
ncbi:MAG: hypothetical protein H7A08_01245 [Oceanospirillaceae bacterium]|nr:hypothetical protein [Oceanospirillaceae bacterium]MCP5350585.1 hypothetical protein [Oceanospirillaceae bacterium]